MAYEIGYCKPPKGGQFKKGKSGNPKGRPKGASNFLTVLEKELNKTIVINEAGKKKTVSRMQAIVKRIVAGALQAEQRTLLTMVEILRRAGKFDDVGTESLVPDDYEAILDAFVSQRLKSAKQQSI